VALLLVVLPFLLEAGFRLGMPAGPAPPLRYDFTNRLVAEARNADALVVPSTTRFWSLGPGRRDPVGGDPINSLGLRGPEPGAAPALRVVVLGDECVYGTPNGYPQTTPARLARRLRALRPEAAIEVLDAGVPGYSLVQSARLFEERLAALSPRVLVLASVGWNDAAAAIGASDLARIEGDDGRGTLERLYEPLRGSRVVQWLAGTWAGTLRYRHWRATVDSWRSAEPPDGTRVPPEDFARVLEQLLQRCAALDCAVIVVLPELDATRREGYEACYARLETMRAILQEAAGRHALPVVDQRALFPPETHPEVYVDRVCLGPKGHLWLAHALAERIAALGARAPGAAPRRAPLLIDEPRIGRDAGGELHVHVDLGPDAAGSRVRLLAGVTPATWIPRAGPPAPPFVPDAVSGTLTSGVDAERILDADGRATLTVSVPPHLELLASERVLGLALARIGDGGEERWVEETWIDLAP